MLTWVLSLIAACLVGILIGWQWRTPVAQIKHAPVETVSRVADTSAHVTCRIESPDGALVAEKRFRRETLLPTLLWRGQWYTATSESNGTRIYRALKEPHGSHVQ